jgi:hypothetical protein
MAKEKPNVESIELTQQQLTKFEFRNIQCLLLGEK